MSLTTPERTQVTNGLMRWWSSQRESVANCTKANIVNAVAATDDYIESIQTAYNLALPVVVRNNLTVAQKTLLFCVVAMARVSIAFLRRIIGEVD